VTAKTRNLVSFWIIASLIAFLLLWLYGEYVKPSREIEKNHVMSAIADRSQHWDDRVSLSPKLFSIGVSIDKVESHLNSAGFTRSDKVISRGQTMIMPRETSYVRTLNGLICNKEFIVFVAYDDSQRLLGAQGVVSERGCL
jgi:hypothetical protein